MSKDTSSPDTEQETYQGIKEYKIEGQECLKEWHNLLNKNELTDEEMDRLEYIRTKYGNHPMFVQESHNNYDRRAVHSGFGSPDCSCHINPPCQSCVDFTNACEERLDNGEPGCLIVGHDCPIGRGEIRA